MKTGAGIWHLTQASDGLEESLHLLPGVDIGDSWLLPCRSTGMTLRKVPDGLQSLHLLECT